MKWRLNIAALVIIIFIFFNEVGLPHGLQYTAIFAPFFFIKFGLKYRAAFIGFLILSLFYAFTHLFNDQMVWFFYGRSYVLHCLVFTQVVAFYHIVNYKSHVLKQAFDIGIYVNLILLIIGVAFLFAGNKGLMFEVSKVSASVGVIPRFRIFTPEPSYYSMLFTIPLFFYLTQSISRDKRIDFLRISIIVLSLTISFSFGTLSVIFISMFIVYFLRAKNILDQNSRFLILLAIGLASVVFVGAFIITPNNPVFIRLGDIIAGNDNSGNGRIFDPWILTMRMLAKNQDYIFGIGWGQIRIIGDSIIRDFYQYTHDPATKFGLPNILTEITTMFGFFGLTLVLLFQVVMFRVTKVYRSNFRSLIFWFIFIYQFTGSYSSSVMYYCYWVLAFSPRFDKQLKIALTPIITSNKKEVE
jgi:hypothetical protein